MMLQEFDFEIKDKKGIANLVDDHLSILFFEADLSDEPINNSLQDGYLYMIIDNDDWITNVILTLKGDPLNHVLVTEKRQIKQHLN